MRESRAEALRHSVASGELGFTEACAQFESDLLRDALEQSSGNQSRAARALGITRRALKLKLDRYGIKPGD